MENRKLLQAQIDAQQIDKLRIIAIRAGCHSNAEMLRLIVDDFIVRFEERHGKIELGEQISLT